ncbi:unnamed protein product, partial [Ceratitis capitata]
KFSELAIHELLNFYKNTKVLVCDKERPLNSETIKAILKKPLRCHDLQHTTGSQYD